MSSKEYAGGKASTIAIFRVLERYSGKGHNLTQLDIVDYVQKDYGLKVDRKTVGRTINFLKEFRFSSNEKEFAIESFRRQGIYMSTNNSESKIILRSAIIGLNKVRFVYYLRDLEGHEVPDDKPDHPSGEFVVDPYEIISSMGHEYLVCHKDGDEPFLRNLRIDRMKNVEILKEERMALQEIDGCESWVRFNREEYIKKLNYHMLGGKLAYAEFKIPNGKKADMQRAVNILWDELSGFDSFEMRKQQDGWIKVSVRMSRMGIKVFARQFVDMCTLIYPESLLKELKEEFAVASAKYGEEFEKNLK